MTGSLNQVMHKRLAALIADKMCVSESTSRIRGADFTALKTQVVGSLSQFPNLNYKTKPINSAFIKFVGISVHRISRQLGLTASDLINNPELKKILLEHLKTEFQLLLDSKLPKSTCKYAAMASPFGVDKVYQDSHKVFGSSPNTKKLVKTAAGAVIRKIYPSIADAKEAYDKILAETIAIFKAENARGLVKTVATLVFTKRYKTVNQAKSDFDAGNLKYKTTS